MDALAPFYRQGQPIPLTATDYARRSGMTLPQAKGLLCRMWRAGTVKRKQTYDQVVFFIKEEG